MLKIGVTGGIGSGKSLVCRIFSILGAPVYNADNEARRILNEDQQVKEKIKQVFGIDVIKEGKPDRNALAQIVFNDASCLKALNEIVHPAVLTDFMLWVEKNRDFPYIIKEAAILFETGTCVGLDTVILVTAPEELRIQRVKLRNGEEETSIRRRMSNQWPEEKKAALAGLKIINDNEHAILPAIILLHTEFRRGSIPEGLEIN